MDKGIVFYTSNNSSVIDRVMATLVASKLPITCVSLKPLHFGDRRIVLGNLKPSYPTMCRQILTALENSTEEIVFFCEHDVLYHQSHFQFTPTEPDTYYYNENNWRWEYPHDRLITYKNLTSLSGMVVYRETALNHYRLRMQLINDMGDAAYTSREPSWLRRWGYEPGKRKKLHGGVTDEPYATFKSQYPIIDVRTGKTFTRSKTYLREFRVAPELFRTCRMDDIPGWNLKSLFPGLPKNKEDL